MSRHVPRKRFGQHFLHDKRIIQKIIDSLVINDNDIWVEIGPGQGALTHLLPKTIKHLYLIELDRDLASKLEANYSYQNNVSVLNQDILKVDFEQIARQQQQLRLLGNLPYNISTPIFFYLAQFTDCISDMTFMVQKEVADRLAAEPDNKNYGRLTLSAGLRFEITKLFDVGSGAFNPPPKIKSSVIRLKPHARQVEQSLKEQFDLLVRTAFSQRRKTLRNSLSTMINAETFESADISQKLRPESLNIVDFLKLAELSQSNVIIRTD